MCVRVPKPRIINLLMLFMTTMSLVSLEISKWAKLRIMKIEKLSFPFFSKTTFNYW